MRGLPLHWLVIGLFAAYLMVYPQSVLLVAFDAVPEWGTWFGGLLLILQGTAIGAWLVYNYRWRGLLAASSILVLSWLVEHVGVHTGFPFGGYHYTETLNLKIGGEVPLAVPFAWLLVVPASLAITEHMLAQSRGTTLHGLSTIWQATTMPGQTRLSHLRRFGYAVLHDKGHADAALPLRGVPDFLLRVTGAATFALLLDLLIEPMAVYINGYWVWDNTGGGYYGVPGSNFAAWWGTSFVLAFILVLCKDTGSPPTRGVVYGWMPRILYLMSLTMFVVVYIGHGKLLALTIGMLLMGYLLLVRLEPRIVRWILGGSKPSPTAES